MSRERLISLAVTVALHAFVLWSMLHAPQEGPRAQAASPPRARAASTAKAPRPVDAASSEAALSARQPPGPSRAAAGSPPDARPTHDKAWRDAYEAGRGFERTRRDWLRRAYGKQYGEDIAALLELPFGEAWTSLEKLTLEGDKLAADALLELVGACLRLPQASPSPQMIDMLTRRTEPADAAFLQGAYEAEFETQEASRAQCAAEGGFPRLRRLVEKRAGPAPPTMRGDTPADRLMVWEAFRLAFDTEHAPTPEGDPWSALSRRLSNTDGEFSQADVDAVLAAIDTEPRAVDQLAFCFINGCNGIDALPPEERLSWSLRAARDGFYPAVQDVIQQTRDSDPVTAYQWAAFERALWLDGCGPLINAGMLSMLMQWQADAARALTPAERALGERRAAELLARYGDTARALESCPAPR